MPKYDAIVLGLGVMGASALDQLSRRGLRTLGLEQFQIGHDQGSSHGETRIIRRSYFEHPDYVPLVDRSFELWRGLEQDSGIELFCGTGLLLIGNETGVVISGVLAAAEAHGFDLQQLDPRSARRRFPGIEVSDHQRMLFEPQAGFLRVEECIRALVDRACRHGAEIVTDALVLECQANEQGIAVRTADQGYHADHLIVCAGPWSRKALTQLNLPLVVRRKPVFWFEATDPRYSLESGFPIFGFDIPGGFHYGFPSINGRLKVANHTGGDVVSDPSTTDRSIRDADVAEIRRFLAAHLPGVSSHVAKHSVCLYTLTPDENFILDRHPHHANVVLAAGFSGHGFKFAPVMGSAMADFVVDGMTREPVSLFRLARFS